MSLEVKVEIRSIVKKKLSHPADGNTHSFVVFVQGLNGNHIEHFVKQVVFYLPCNSLNPKEVRRKPPYSISGSTHASFRLPIDVFLHTSGKCNKVRYSYYVFLPDKPVENAVCVKTLTFMNCPQDFRERLLHGGAEVVDKRKNSEKSGPLDRCKSEPIEISENQEVPDSENTSVKNVEPITCKTEPIEDINVQEEINSQYSNSCVESKDVSEQKDNVHIQSVHSLDELLKQNEILKKENEALNKKFIHQESLIATYVEKLPVLQNNSSSLNTELNQLNQRAESNEVLISTLKSAVQMLRAEILQQKNKYNEVEETIIRSGIPPVSGSSFVSENSHCVSASSFENKSNSDISHVASPKENGGTLVNECAISVTSLEFPNLSSDCNITQDDYKNQSKSICNASESIAASSNLNYNVIACDADQPHQQASAPETVLNPFYNTANSGISQNLSIQNKISSCSSKTWNSHKSPQNLSSSSACSSENTSSPLNPSLSVKNDSLSAENLSTFDQELQPTEQNSFENGSCNNKSVQLIQQCIVSKPEVPSFEMSDVEPSHSNAQESDLSISDSKNGNILQKTARQCVKIEPQMPSCERRDIESFNLNSLERSIVISDFGSLSQELDSCQKETQESGFELPSLKCIKSEPQEPQMPSCERRDIESFNLNSQERSIVISDFGSLSQELDSCQKETQESGFELPSLKCIKSEPQEPQMPSCERRDIESFNLNSQERSIVISDFGSLSQELESCQKETKESAFELTSLKCIKSEPQEPPLEKICSEPTNLNLKERDPVVNLELDTFQKEPYESAFDLPSLKCIKSEPQEPPLEKICLEPTNLNLQERDPVVNLELDSFQKEPCENVFKSVSQSCIKEEPEESSLDEGDAERGSSKPKKVCFVIPNIRKLSNKYGPLVRQANKNVFEEISIQQSARKEPLMSSLEINKEASDSNLETMNLVLLECKHLSPGQDCFPNEPCKNVLEEATRQHSSSELLIIDERKSSEHCSSSLKGKEPTPISLKIGLHEHSTNETNNKCHKEGMQGFSSNQNDLKLLDLDLSKTNPVILNEKMCTKADVLEGKLYKNVFDEVKTQENALSELHESLPKRKNVEITNLKRREGNLMSSNYESLSVEKISSMKESTKHLFKESIREHVKDVDSDNNKKGDPVVSNFNHLNNHPLNILPVPGYGAKQSLFSVKQSNFCSVATSTPLNINKPLRHSTVFERVNSSSLSNHKKRKQVISNHNKILCNNSSLGRKIIGFMSVPSAIPLKVPKVPKPGNVSKVVKESCLSSLGHTQKKDRVPNFLLRSNPSLSRKIPFLHSNAVNQTRHPSSTPLNIPIPVNNSVVKQICLPCSSNLLKPDEVVSSSIGVNNPSLSRKRTILLPFPENRKKLCRDKQSLLSEKKNNLGSVSSATPLNIPNLSNISKLNQSTCVTKQSLLSEKKNNPSSVSSVPPLNIPYPTNISTINQSNYGTKQSLLSEKKSNLSSVSSATPLNIPCPSNISAMNQPNCGNKQSLLSVKHNISSVSSATPLNNPNLPNIPTINQLNCETKQSPLSVMHNNISSVSSVTPLNIPKPVDVSTVKEVSVQSLSNHVKPDPVVSNTIHHQNPPQSKRFKKSLPQPSSCNVNNLSSVPSVTSLNIHNPAYSHPCQFLPSCSKSQKRDEIFPNSVHRINPSQNTKKSTLVSSAGSRNKHCETIRTILFGIDDKPMYKLKLRPYIRSLTQYLMNPVKFPNISSLIFCIVDHLCLTRKNYLVLFIKDPPNWGFLPSSERCIVSALFAVEEKSERHLKGLIKNVLSTIYHLLMTKKKMNVFVLASLSRVFTEICRLHGDISKPLTLCADIIKVRYWCAPYLVASIAGVWRKPFTLPNDPSDEAMILIGAISLGAGRRSYKMPDSTWLCSTELISEYFGYPSLPDANIAMTFLEDKIISDCKQNSHQKSWMTTSSFAIIAAHESWDWTKKHLYDYVIPNLYRFSSQEPNEKAFALFCDLFVDILNVCPNISLAKVLLNYFEQTPYKDIKFVQEWTSISLMKYMILKRMSIPNFLLDWYSKNQEKPNLKKLKEFYKRRHMFENEEQLTIKDIVIT